MCTGWFALGVFLVCFGCVLRRIFLNIFSHKCAEDILSLQSGLAQLWGFLPNSFLFVFWFCLFTLLFWTTPVLYLIPQLVLWELLLPVAKEQPHFYPFIATTKIISIFLPTCLPLSPVPTLVFAAVHIRVWRSCKLIIRQFPWVLVLRHSPYHLSLLPSSVSLVQLCTDWGQTGGSRWNNSSFFVPLTCSFCGIAGCISGWKSCNLFLWVCWAPAPAGLLLPPCDIPPLKSGICPSKAYLALRTAFSSCFGSWNWQWKWLCKLYVYFRASEVLWAGWVVAGVPPVSSFGEFCTQVSCLSFCLQGLERQTMHALWWDCCGSWYSGVLKALKRTI